MFEQRPFATSHAVGLHAVAASPVVRVAEAAPAGRHPHSLRLDAALAGEPGAGTVTLLAPLHPERLDDVDRVRLLQAWERVSRWVASRHCEAVVGVAGGQPASRDDEAREYVRVALLGTASPGRTVEVARALAGPLGSARAALGRGEISVEHARVLVEETAFLDEATARQVCAATVGAAVERGSGQVVAAPSALRRTVRRAVLAADPLAAELRAERATAARQVTRRTDPDAQATLTVTGPAADVSTVWGVLDGRAGSREPGDRRTLDQRRFDALVNLCRESLGGTGGRSGAVVHVFADAATWAGLADEPVELAGYGPIPAGTARAAFSSAAWRAVVTDAVTGAVTGLSSRPYTPPAALVRRLHAADRHCLFPGCPAAAAHCDVDHGTAWSDGGCTDAENCGLLCRRHHRLKTFTRWRWVRLGDGTVRWTDPHGREWDREPYRYALPPPAEDQKSPHGRVGPAPQAGAAGPARQPATDGSADPPPS